MKYLLNEEEYLVFKDNKKIAELNSSLAFAMARIREDLLKEADFKCIHDRETSTSSPYCDKCPISPIKNRHNHTAWKVLCGLKTNYSK